MNQEISTKIGRNVHQLVLCQAWYFEARTIAHFWVKQVEIKHENPFPGIVLIELFSFSSLKVFWWCSLLHPTYRLSLSSILNDIWAILWKWVLPRLKVVDLWRMTLSYKYSCWIKTANAFIKDNSIPLNWRNALC